MPDFGGNIGPHAFMFAKKYVQNLEKREIVNKFNNAKIGATVKRLRKISE